MITIIALVMQVLMALITPQHADVVIIPPVPNYSPKSSPDYCTPDCECWVCYEDDAYLEYYEEFTALFNSYTYKLSKNGRSMINGKFVAMGAK